MKPFNLNEYLKNPSRKVVTRDRKEVRIICTDRHSVNFPVVALVKDDNEYEMTLNYTKEGINNVVAHDIDLDTDLFFVDETPDFKPYDRVLTRRHYTLPWKADLFSNFKKVGGNTIIAVCLSGDYLLNDIILFDENKVGKIE